MSKVNFNYKFGCGGISTKKLENVVIFCLPDSQLLSQGSSSSCQPFLLPLPISCLLPGPWAAFGIAYRSSSDAFVPQARGTVSTIPYPDSLLAPVTSLCGSPPAVWLCSLFCHPDTQLLLIPMCLYRSTLLVLPQTLPSPFASVPTGAPNWIFPRTHSPSSRQHLHLSQPAWCSPFHNI